MLEPELDRVIGRVVAQNRVTRCEFRCHLDRVDPEPLREERRAQRRAFLQPAADDRTLVEHVAPRQDRPVLAGRGKQIGGAVAVGDDELRHVAEDGVTDARCHGQFPFRAGRASARSGTKTGRGASHDRHHRHRRPRDSRQPRQPDRRGRRRSSRTARWAAPRCPRAPRPARTRRSSCATATRRAISARASRKAVDAVNGEIFEAIGGMEAEDQIHIDRTLIELDGTPNKGRLGANAILGVSLAVAKAAAEASALPLYRYVGGVNAHVLPVPMMNIINGGAHADNPIDFQEFMILPVGAETFRRGAAHGRRGLPHAEEGAEGRAATTPMSATRAASRRTSSRRRKRSSSSSRRSRRPATSRARTSRSASTAPRPSSSRTASTSMKARARPAAATSRSPISPTWSSDFPIVSIEDGMAEDDWDGWKTLTDAIGDEVPARRRRSLRHQHAAARGRHQARRRQLDPDQGQPDRHADRDARRRRDGDTAPTTRR